MTQSILSSEPQAVLSGTLEEAWNAQLKIDELQEKIMRLQAERDRILNDHVASGQMQEGPFFINSKLTKGRRAIDDNLFRTLHPAEYQEAIEAKRKEYEPSLTLKDAEKVLPKKDLDGVCSIGKSSISYSIEWDPHYGVEV